VSVESVGRPVYMSPSFTKWVRWIHRKDLPGLSYPGVYCLAISSTDISGRPFKWMPEIKYFGMTNAKGGVKSVSFQNKLDK